ncbi:MAG: cupin [Oceanospirillaceae bacterium]|nr:cupin [Oceanospirillaceae bacterium]MBT10831.1 cupin [Oceanospirillaceae bacterium]|tara:strand:- start:10874 stop:11428 length:555 start_codon:yes stop_codon:yes gene_type:complete
MSVIRIYKDSNLSHTTDLLFTSENKTKIRDRLQEIGVRFEQWLTPANLSPGADENSVIEAYQQDIDRLMAEEGYQTVDVVSLDAHHPQKKEMREKFLSEHTHSEDEVRFFVAGHGLFSMHVDGKVYEVLCHQGDLISVPANTRHWFDMGPNPNFIAIRMFNNPDGWVANFTGDQIATHFNRLDN